MSETYSKNQQNKRIKRELDLLRFRQEYEKHGNKDTVQAKGAAKEAARGSAKAKMVRPGDAPSIRKDGNGD